MFKKLMAILIVALLMLSCVGTAVMAEGDTVTTTVNVLEEVLIKAANPDVTYNTPEKRGAKPDSTTGEPWYCYTLNEASASGSTVLQKFDVSSYVYPVDNATLSVEYRGSGDYKILLFKTSTDWSSENATWNSFGGETFDFSKEGVNYINTCIGTDVTNSEITNSINVTDYLNEVLLSGKKYMSVAYARDVPVGEEKENVFRIGTNKSRLNITTSEPVYKTEGTVEKFVYKDRTLISSAYDTVAPPYAKSYGFYYEQGSAAIGLSHEDSNVEPYGVSRTNYIKFNVNKIENRSIKKVTISYYASSKNTNWGIYHYIVDNDNWRGALGTGTQESELLWKDVFPVDEETSEVKPTTYAPNKSKYVYEPASAKGATGSGIITTEKDNSGILQEFDITSIAKPEIEDENFDGVLSIAVMVKDWVITKSSTKNAVRIIFNNATTIIPKYNTIAFGPYINIIYDDAGEVTSPKENISFKINDTEAATLSNGVFKAETTITNTMYDSTKATIVMSVYEGDRLCDIFVKSFVVEDRNTNGGRTTLSVSSDREITVTEDTRVRVMVWNGLCFMKPANEGKIITAQ